LLLDDPTAAGLAPALVVAIAAVIVERLATLYYRERWPGVVSLSLALVVSATGLAFVSVSQSDLLGPAWTTAGWSLTAAVVMVLGFTLRAAVYRRVALAAFALTLLRVFTVDVQGLSSGGQTVAFLTLGLLLVAVYWLYARFSDQLRKWL
jgi:uncharacterized membrane protein